ncbi:MAG TPA: hypothetical protein VHG89_04445 [Verrucomicrobiae bacterium]|nr:hypothetical protein [Verrucomicrobiae bacterium]
MKLIFSSSALKRSRPALEELLFFNPRQSRVRDGIVHSLEQFGHPRIEETSDRLSVRVGESEAQTIFAFDQDRPGNDPIGVVIFVRTSTAEMVVMHVAVHSDYQLQNRYADLGLGFILLEKVREIASRIVGVRQVTLHYRREIVIKI